MRAGWVTNTLRLSTGLSVAVSVDAAIDGALLLVGPRLRENGVRLVRARSPEGLKVMAERNRLEQVVLNLLQNAIEALEGVPDPVVTIAVATRGRRVTLRITDNGPGISDEVIGRLFTPFSTDKRDGLGLGLVISRDIVVGFGGELVHEPTPRGAAFRLTLARAR